MNVHTALRIRKDRLAQIRDIASARKMTIGELLADWINREIDAGTIAPGIPGVEIEIKSSGQSSLTLGDVMMLADDSAEALAFSQRLRDVATDTLTGYRNQYPTIFRNGPGVVVEDSMGHKFSATKGMALEIAAHIQNEVTKHFK